MSGNASQPPLYPPLPVLFLFSFFALEILGVREFNSGSLVWFFWFRRLNCLDPPNFLSFSPAFCFFLFNL